MKEILAITSIQILKFCINNVKSHLLYQIVKEPLRCYFAMRMPIRVRLRRS